MHALMVLTLMASPLPAQVRPFGAHPAVVLAQGQQDRATDFMVQRLKERLKLTDEQKKELAALQKETDAKLDSLLKEDQKKQLKQMQDLAKNFPAGPPGGGPPGGGFPGFGAPGGGGMFRAPRYAADYPGLKGKDLKPGKTIEELQAKDPSKKEEPKDK